MANKPFESVITNPLERPTSTDINLLQMQAHYDVRQFAWELFGRQDGFLGYSFDPTRTEPASNYIAIQQGVAFQYGTAEDNIGSIQGLSDVYLQKAINGSNRSIEAQAAPTTAGYKRYDLIQIRAPKNAERLKNETDVGIFDPALKTISGQSKYKTLTSSLDEFSVVYIASSAVGTTPLVYKSGAEGAYASWEATPKPVVDSGYMAVAYIKRYTGQTVVSDDDIEDARSLLSVAVQSGGTGVSNFLVGSVLIGNGSNGIDSIMTTPGGVLTGLGEYGIASTLTVPGAILLGNGFNGITSTNVLAVSKGGTGSTGASYNGSVPWFNSDANVVGYTQALEVVSYEPLEYAPVSGHLLASSATGAPGWIAPGAAGQPLVSTSAGTFQASYADPYRFAVLTGSQTIDSDGWTTLTALTLEDVVYRVGPARIKLQPKNSTIDDVGLSGGIEISSDQTLPYYCFIKFRIEVAATSALVDEFMFFHYVRSQVSGQANTFPVAFPSVDVMLAPNTYNIYVAAKALGPASVTIRFQNCVSVFSQG